MVVLDERGEHAISLVSGHLGGANDLARRIADCIGAKPVITTASDLKGVPAIDLIARDRRLTIENPDAIREACRELSLQGPGSDPARPLEKLTEHLRNMRKRLVAIVAGRRDDGEMLMDLINRGKVYRLRALDIPERERTAKGMPITTTEARDVMVRAVDGANTFFTVGIDTAGRAALNILWAGDADAPAREVTLTGHCRNHERYLERWTRR